METGTCVKQEGMRTEHFILAKILKESSPDGLDPKPPYILHFLRSLDNYPGVRDVQTG